MCDERITMKWTRRVTTDKPLPRPPHYHYHPHPTPHLQQVFVGGLD